MRQGRALWAPASVPAVLLLGLVVLGQMTPPSTVDAATAPAPGGFLENALPLTIVVTTPVEIKSAPAAESVTLSGSQALQVVFSRPVIALGSDFGADTNYGGKVPFTLTCSAPGRFRWVTTAIARWDPDQDWPTDLDCALQWKTDLTSYDGVPLNLTGVPFSRRLVTAGLTLSLSSVTSARAENLTGSYWSATTGAPWDNLPEVPPDGIITLDFNYQVNLALLASALRLAADNGASIPLNISRCQSPLPVWNYLSVTGTQSAAVPLDLNYNDTCAQVQALSPLTVAGKYTLYLPVGARYFPLSGPLKQEVSTTVYGLRSFRVPLRQDFQQTWNGIQSIYYGPGFRRLDAWLPHGLSANTTVESLAAQISLCYVQNPFKSSSPCIALNFTVSLAKPGLARLSVPDLEPHQFCKLSVAASSSVHDGFGLPLLDSKQSFWTTDTPGYFLGPLLNSNVAVIEHTPQPVEWPFLAAIGVGAANAPSPDISSAASFAVPLHTDKDYATLVRILTQGQQLYIPDILGPPTSEVSLLSSPNPSKGPTQLTLSLDPALASVYVVHTCCSYQRWQSPPTKTSATVNIVDLTTLSASFVSGPTSITAFVTNATAHGAGPVSDAKVRVYLYLYNTAAPGFLGSCITDAGGTCSVSLVGTAAHNGQLVGVATAGKDSVVVGNAGYWSPPSPSPFLGTLVADRLLVRPGEALHLTGYLQRQNAAHLSLPSAGTNISLQFSAGWDPAHPSSTVNVPVVLTPDTGSFHATVPVPESGVIGPYSVSMVVTAPQGKSARRRRASAQAATGAASQDLPVTSRSVVRASEHLPLHTSHRPQLNGRRASAGGRKRSNIAVMAPHKIQPPTQTSVAQITITVADPRPPTASLTLTLPTWSRLNASIPVTILAESLIGTSVAGASVSITWTTSNAHGSATIVTNAAGSGSTIIDLGALPPANQSTAGDVVHVQAQWIGPTREVLVQSGSVSLQLTSRTVTVQQQPTTDVPGVPFGVTVSVISSVDGSTIVQVPVKLTLVPVDDEASECNTNPPTCNLISGDLDLAACQLSLPCIGQFNLTACTNDNQEQACTAVQVGRNTSSWEARPLASPPPFVITLVNQSQTFKLGETAGVAIQVPRDDSSLLLIWGNSVALRNHTLTDLQAGPVVLPLVLGSECKGGCGVMAVLSAPRATAVSQAPAVPTSLLFDPLRPITASASLTLNVLDDNSLNVSLHVGAAPSSSSSDLPSVLPGSSTSINITVLHDGEPIKNAEVTVIAVDKAILDLLPYPLQDLSAAMVQQLVAILSEADIDSLRVSSDAVRAAFAAALRRSLEDPWVTPDLQSQPQNWGTAPVDMSDEQYLQGFTSPLTYLPTIGFPCRGCLNDFLVGASIMTNALAKGTEAGQASVPAPSPSGAAASSSSPRLESDFLSTPLFTTARTDASGLASVTFVAPANLGTFVVRAYAVAGAAAEYGSAETQLLVRRPVSLTPSLPRFARVGDTFEAGVIVTDTAGLTPSDPPVMVNVTLILGGSALKLLSGANWQAVTLTANLTQVEVRFSYQAVALGSATLTFTVYSSGGSDPADVLDSVELDLDVEAQQGSVVLATSFPVRAPNTTSGYTPWQEGLVLPAAVPGSGALDLLAGVGNLPAILTSYTSLATAYNQSTQPNGYSAFALVTLYPASAAYRQPLTADAQNASATAAQDLLTQLNSKTLGLLDTPPSSYIPKPAADIVLNSWASWLATSWASVIHGEGQGDTIWARISGLASDWQDAAAAQLLADAAASRAATPPSAYNDFNSLAWARLALGADWQPPVCGRNGSSGSNSLCAVSATVAQDVSLQRLVQVAPEAGLTVQLLTALALQQGKVEGPSGKPPLLVTQTLDLVLSSTRIAGRTAYVSSVPGGAGAADTSTQALALLLLQGAPPGTGSSLLLQKIAAYIAVGTPPSLYPGFSPSPSPFATALAARALVSYDSVAGSTTPNLYLEAAVLNHTFLKAHFNSATVSLPPVQSSTPWELLPKPSSSAPLTLDFQANGTGEASIAAVLTFVPASPLPFTSYRGLWLEAAIQLVDPDSGATTGPSLRTIPLGSLVTITVQVTTADDLGAVTVSVLMPAGLEPLDPNVNSGAQNSASCGLDSASLSSAFWWWWWPACPSQQTLPSQVTFRYTRLMAGTSSVQFTAVAATPGLFVLPPFSASAEQQPEVMGMTAASELQVCVAQAGSACVAEAATQTTAARSCPNDCNGNGACRLDKGQCDCAYGFAGADCSQVSAL